MGIRVLIADGQPLIRGGLALLLAAQPGIEVVGQAGTAGDALDLVAAHAPDVVLMEIRLPGLDGAETIRRIAASSVSTRALILTARYARAEGLAVLRAGAAGLLSKDAAPDRLVEAIRAVADGGAWLDPVAARDLVHEFARQPCPATAHGPGFDRLTARERQVLVLVAQGLSNAEVARHLYVAECTVKTHVTRILLKLGSRDRAHAVAMAYHAGLVRVWHPAA